MAKRSSRRTRTMAARIYLTTEAYKQVEASAFKNCRTVPQELTFMVESLLVKRAATPARYDSPEPIPERYDDPAPRTAAPEPTTEAPEAAPQDDSWTPEQEAQVIDAGHAKGLSPAQITALRLIHKTPEAVFAAIESEVKEVATI